MRRVLVAAFSAIGLLAISAPAYGQTNDNDHTPLGSRIRHDRQFPFDPPPNIVPPDKMDTVTRNWDRAMLNQFSKCLYNRSQSGALNLLAKTDFGFVDFQQIGLATDKAVRVYGFDDCLHRVAESNQSGVVLHYSAPSLRRWLIQAAYMANYPHAPTWLKPGYVIGPRDYPLSIANPRVHTAMDFADCVVSADPYDADYYFRTAAGSKEEKEALTRLTPSLGPCLPRGLRIQLDPETLRTWLGEGLWHASNHSAAAPDEAPQNGH